MVRLLADEGQRKLLDQQYDDASRIFNAALKFSPQDAQLHFLNGLAYHLLYLRGDEAMRELAGTGYELALRQDPAHAAAALQLGRLEMEGKRYEKAMEAFRHAAQLDPSNAAAFLGLAVAAYYARDLVAARRAVERVAALLPDDADGMRAAAMIYAAQGEDAKAREAEGRYVLLERDPRARTRLAGRLDQWRMWHASEQAQPGDEALAAPPAAVPATPVPGGDSGQGRGTSLRAWFDCGGASPAPSTASASSDSNDDKRDSLDQVPALASLPAPCEGAGSPRMAILDVVFIRTENNASTSHGINLLEGLGYFLGAGRVVSDVINSTTGAREATITRTRARGLPPAGVTYSLNIANATDTRAEVLAKPSLVALDRMPSTFFSGRNVTLGIAGQAGGASLVADRPVGVSLSVTPTFIDDDSMLLAVRAARSFVEVVDQAVRFGNSLQTSKNVVAANVVLRIGQTLILSGLSEQEIQRTSNGVPVLKDIPGLQYLFGTKVTQNFTTSVLVIITPRTVTGDGALMSSTISHLDTLGGDKRAYRPLIGQALKASPHAAPGSLEDTYRHSFGNKLFLQFRSGDVAIQHWSEPARLERFLRDLRELAYH